MGTAQRYAALMVEEPAATFQYTLHAPAQQIDITAIGQGNPVEHGKAVFTGKKVVLYPPFPIWLVTLKRLDMGIRWIPTTPLTKPIIGGIKGDIGSKVGRLHRAIIDGCGEHVNKDDWRRVMLDLGHLRPFADCTAMSAIEGKLPVRITRNPVGKNGRLGASIGPSTPGLTNCIV
jgi:hypothetical protein